MRRIALTIALLLALAPRTATAQIRTGSELYAMLSTSAEASARNFSAAGRHSEAAAWNAWANHYMILAMGTMPWTGSVEVARSNYSMAAQNANTAAQMGWTSHAAFYRTYAGFWQRLEGWLRGTNQIPTLPVEMTVVLQEAPMTPWYTVPATGFRPGSAAYETCMEEKRRLGREGRIASASAMRC
ncbi:MAG: hypothetical protein ACJ8GN_21275 [Longimicrobiaceae bacterium]